MSKKSGRMDRRDFVKLSVLLGATTMIGVRISEALGKMERISSIYTDSDKYNINPLAKPESIIYSACLQCHTACSIKCKILDGVLVKIDGNPYSPQTLLPHIPYNTEIGRAARIDAAICPKGQAGITTLYDPYRIRKVLKRAGPRGSNKWKTISFEQAIQEIVEGGYLFRDIPGEENRYVPGLKEIWVWGRIREKGGDPSAISAEMAKDISALRSTPLEGRAKAVEEFKGKWSEKLGALGLKLEDVLIDQDHPDLGTKANQFVFMAGRIEHGRIEFSKRWLIDAFGSVNWYEHTTICEQSHHIAYKMISGKTHMKPDIINSEFIIFFGTGAFEANFGPSHMSGKITSSLTGRNFKYAVVDPRMSKTAAKAWRWVPIKPGTDGAFALGMIRWIIENERYDKAYLECADMAAAREIGEPSFTNATYLVRTDNGKFLRASEIGIGNEKQYVVISKDTGALTSVNPYDDKRPVRGELSVWEKIRLANGEEVEVKSAFQLLWESVSSRSLEEWANVCGVSPQDIVLLADEFTRHGKRAVVELYRGPVQHTNGYYNGQAIITLNLLVGNVGWKGGLSQGGGHWHEMGDKRDGPFNLNKLHPGKISAIGVKLTREGSRFQDSTLALTEKKPRRPWFPFTGNVYQEILPAADDGYPYPIKALLLHMGTPAYATPAANTQLRIIKDVNKIPLFIACDIVIAETSMYADYIFPDLSIWERWSTPHASPDVQTISSIVRQPTVGPLVETASVFGEEMPICMESIMLAIAEKLGLPGYGEDGFGKGMPFKRMEDFYLKMVANIAAGDKEGEEVPDADEEELSIFRKARTHLPSSVFDEEKWRKAVVDQSGKDWWRKVVYVLNRGGRYEGFENAYEGEYLKHRYTGMLNMYAEQVGSYYDPFRERMFSGTPIYEPTTDSAGNPVEDGEYPLRLITYKEITGGQSRTIGNYWLLAVLPYNPVLINEETARELGLRKGDVVKIVSKTNQDGVWLIGPSDRPDEKIYVEGIVHPVKGVAKDVVAVSWHYGHWAYGANTVEIDGVLIRGDSRRAAGTCPNAVMREDPVLKNVCLTDPIGGSASFYDTGVKLLKK